MQKEKAPSTAATMQGAYIEQNHKENTTKSLAGQGLFQAASALDDLGTQLSTALGLLNLVTDSMELASHPEGSRIVPTDTLAVYTDSLWVLFRFLEGLQGEAKAQAERFYQERRRAQ